MGRTIKAKYYYRKNIINENYKDAITEKNYK